MITKEVKRFADKQNLKKRFVQGDNINAHRFLQTGCPPGEEGMKWK